MKTARSIAAPSNDRIASAFLPRRGLERLVRKDPAAAYVLSRASVHAGVDPKLLLSARRGQATVAAARQLAMYLVHVALGRSLTEVGVVFGRDRTTVAHACALIEDQRDEVAFDTVLCGIEADIAVFQNRVSHVAAA